MAWLRRRIPTQTKAGVQADGRFEVRTDQHHRLINRVDRDLKPIYGGKMISDV